MLVSVPAPQTPRAVQERSRRTHDRIYQAGTKLLEQHGPSALTVANVASAAGVSTGTIYRRFGSKEQLLAVIQHEFVEDFKAEMARRLALERIGSAASLDEIVGTAVRGFAETFRARQRLLRVLMLVLFRLPRVVMVPGGLPIPHSIAPQRLGCWSMKLASHSATSKNLAASTLS